MEKFKKPAFLLFLTTILIFIVHFVFESYRINHSYYGGLSWPHTLLMVSCYHIAPIFSTFMVYVLTKKRHL